MYLCIKNAVLLLLWVTPPALPLVAKEVGCYPTGTLRRGKALQLTKIKK